MGYSNVTSEQHWRQNGEISFDIDFVIEILANFLVGYLFWGHVVMRSEVEYCVQ